MEEFCGSQFWDWHLTWTTESNPDFTPCFERLVVSNIPCAFLWIFFLVDIYSSYHSGSKKILWGPLNGAKVALTLILILLEGGLLTLSTVIFTEESYPVEVYVPAIRFATLILAMLLLLYSKWKGIRTSGVQFIFWLLFTVTQAIRFRTVVILQQNLIEEPHLTFFIEVVYFPLSLGLLLLHCWADQAPEYQNEFEIISNPERTCSFLSKILFEWYTHLTWTGFRKPLETSDLWELDKEMRCENVVPKFDLHWPTNLNSGIQPNEEDIQEEGKKVKRPQVKKSSEKGRSNKNSSVVVTTIKAFGGQYLCGLALKVVPDLMVFVSPLILSLLIGFVESDQEPRWKGILYASLLFGNAFLGTLFGANGVHRFCKFGIKMRSSFVSAVYRKSLLLSPSAKRNQSTGEIINRMAVDAQYLSDFSQSAHLLLTIPLIFSTALYFLSRILGWAALAGLVIMVLLIPVNGLVASRIKKLQKEQMALKDKRVKLMPEILNGMKCLKLQTWEPSFEKKVMGIRKEELRVLKHMAFYNSLSNFLWGCTPFLVAPVTFATFVMSSSENILNAQTAFVSLSLFNIMSYPLSLLPIMISNTIQASVSLKRLNEYLNADEINVMGMGVSHDETEKDPIVIENASFTWVPSEDNNNCDNDTLKNINLRVKDGELVGIVGPVGCGKSSLLSTLLNELVNTSESKCARVHVRGSIAYVSQQAWIQNATLRDNILFGKCYDPIKFKKVVKACALLPDIEILPAGDQTEIGENGANLSGGQKQRVSLARAVYSDADIFLLDTPLCSVDAEVGKHIFNKVIGPHGLLQNKTRLLVTHGVAYLPHLDKIVVMTAGKISETGSYEELQKKGGAFSEFLKQHTSAAAEEVKEPSSPGIVKENLESDLSISNIHLDSKQENKLIQPEKPEVNQVKSSVYLDYFRAAGWGMVSATLVMYLIFQGFSVGASFWLSEWTTLKQGNMSNNATQEKGDDFYLRIYGALGLFQGISLFLASLIIALAGLKSANVLHWKMLTRVLRAPLQFFDATPVGRLMNRFSKDVDSLDNVLPIYLRLLVTQIFNVLAVLVVISLSTPIFTVVILPVGLVYYFVQRFYIGTSRQLKRLEGVSRSPIFSHFGETVAGASTIRAYGHQKRFILESDRRQDQNMKVLYYSVTSNRWLQIRLETVGNTLVFFAALFAVLGREILSPGLVGLSISYALQITVALMGLVRYTSDVETFVVAVERIKEYSECPQEASWRAVWRPSTSWPQAGAIVFDQFKARYRPGLDLVLKNVTCTIRAGEKVGVAGRTGAGKSSLTLALFRIVEPAGGRIEVDGKDITRFGLHDLRKGITIIPQEPTLFSGPLRGNLDPFEMKTDKEMWRALELAHLKEFVDGLPGGLDYEIVEGGENLSVGQRQLVCLARALLRKTKILILDEASSAVDLDTELLIQETIRTEFKESTVIAIAHRLNSVMDSERVIVMDNGEIGEFDTPQNLLANPNSMFYGMAKEAGLLHQQKYR